MTATLEARRTTAVWRHFLHEARSLALGFTVVTVIFWLPLFLFQVILVKAAHVSDMATLQTASNIFSPIFYFLLVPIMRRIAALVSKWNERRLEALEAKEDAIQAAASPAAPPPPHAA